MDNAKKKACIADWRTGASALAGAIGLAVMLAGCAGEKIQTNSTWRSTQIQVDRDPAAWDSALVFADDGNIGYGIQNDGSYLYLCVKADQATMRRAMAGGLTVWFDSSGQRNKAFGLHFPLGFAENRSLDGPNPAGAESGEPPEQLRSRTDKAEIVVQDKAFEVESGALSSYGIEAAINVSEGRYELRVPLRPDVPGHYAIGTSPGNVIAIGIETGQFSRPSAGNRFGSREGRGGGEGFGGERPRRGGFGRGGSGPERRDGSADSGQSLDIWIMAHLAAQRTG